jgi:hypothetical protein
MVPIAPLSATSSPALTGEVNDKVSRTALTALRVLDRDLFIVGSPSTGDDRPTGTLLSPWAGVSMIRTIDSFRA